MSVPAPTKPKQNVSQQPAAPKATPDWQADLAKILHLTDQPSLVLPFDVPAPTKSNQNVSQQPPTQKAPADLLAILGQHPPETHQPSLEDLGYGLPVPTKPKQGTAAKPFSTDSLPNFTETEIDAALEKIDTPQVKGLKRPTIADKAVPTTRIRRRDLEDIARAGETPRQALNRIYTVIGKTVGDTPLHDAWEAARRQVLGNRDIDAVTSEEMIAKGGLYDQVRDKFWNNVENSDTCRRYLNNAGFDFTGGPAPILQVTAADIGVQELRISLDHTKEKAIDDNWRYAIEGNYLRLEFQNPNSFRESMRKKLRDVPRR